MRRILPILLLWMLTPPLLFAATPVPVEGRQGVVASASALASEVGVSIMKQGGNAIDAAVAVGFALAVTYPSAGNLGGGGFMVIHTQGGDQVALDFREVAPLSAHRTMYLDDQGNVTRDSVKTHKAAGVPGSVAGLLDALEKYGTLKRRDVLKPAIELAQKGFVLPAHLAAQFEKQLESMAAYPASMETFSRNGVPYVAGDLWKQPDLAKTLQRIADQGKEGFYKGETAQLIVDEMARGNGQITLEDLARYQAKWREPVSGTYRGYRVTSMPPPSSGGVLILEMLNMLSPYPVAELGWNSAELVHLMVEAERRAYADRAVHLGDPDFYAVPVETLISPEYAKQRFSDIDSDKATDSEAVGAGRIPAESPETTHYSVMDAKGNAVAVTTTLNWGYGNKIVVAGAGFLLNNEMDDFAAKPGVPNSYGLLGSEANAIQPRKRMLSSMSPTIVSQAGRPLLVTGSPGGSTIITTTLQVILNIIDHKMSLNDAVGLPRFHHQWKPNQIFYEPYALSPDTLKQLKQKQHQGLTVSKRLIGDANSVLFRDGVLQGVNDPRNQGGTAAY